MALFTLDGVSPELCGENFVAPDASLIGRVRLEKNASVWFQAVLRGDNELIQVGENANIQDGSVLHTDMGAPLIVGEGVTVGHKVILHGCNIGAHSLVGMGSTIMNNARIGSGSIVGANSFVAEGKEIPEGVLALGAPARVMRDLSDIERQMIRASAMVYVENGRRFLAGLVC